MVLLKPDLCVMCSHHQHMILDCKMLGHIPNEHQLLAHHLVDFDALQLAHHLQPRHKLVGRRGGEHQHLGDLPQRPQRRHEQVVADADDGPDEGRQRPLGALLACDGGGGADGCGVSR